MRVTDIKAASAEARRFLDRAKQVKAEPDEDYIFWSSKETAALRRASMDLTRALATLRSRRS